MHLNKERIWSLEKSMQETEEIKVNSFPQNSEEMKNSLECLSTSDKWLEVNWKLS